MKKIIFSSLFLFAFAGFSQAQTSEKETTPAPKVEAANPAAKTQAKSCCAAMAESGKKSCDNKAEANAATPGEQPQTATTNVAPDAGTAEKSQVIAAGASKSVMKTSAVPAVKKAEQK